MSIIKNKPKIIFIVGPTASGKSKVGIELAKLIGGEIVSCDSMQIYKNMDIINQAIKNEDMQDVSHHLIREISPEKEYSVAEYIEDATKAIEDMLSRKKTPIFVGGTGLYIKSLIEGIFASPKKDENLREELSAQYDTHGPDKMHEELKKIDPVSGKKLHKNDKLRIVRAIEIYKLTGKTISENQNESKGSGGLCEKFNCLMFGLDWPREVLYEKINSNVDEMFDAGLVSEVESLVENPISKTASKALGIKEVMTWIRGAGDVDMENVKELLKKNTRNYAKRQLTWFRADKRIRWIKGNRDAMKIAREIMVKCDK